METQIVKPAPSKVQDELLDFIQEQKVESGNLLMLAGALHDEIEVMHHPEDAARINEILVKIEKILKRKYL